MAGETNWITSYASQMPVAGFRQLISQIEADVGVFNAQDLPGPACSITETANGGVTVNLGNKDIRVSLTGKSINAYKGEKNAFGQYGWTQLFTLALSESALVIRPVDEKSYRQVTVEAASEKALRPLLFPWASDG